MGHGLGFYKRSNIPSIEKTLENEKLSVDMGNRNLDHQFT